MSISSAPSFTAVCASKIFTEVVFAPSGKPITVQTFTGESFKSSEQNFT